MGPTRLTFIVAAAVAAFLIFAPVVPQNIVLHPRCLMLGGETACPDFLVLQRASVSPTYYAFGFGGVLALPGLSYSLHWTQWRYL